MKFADSRFFLLSMLLFTFISCGNNDEITTTPVTPRVPTATVAVEDNFFKPDSLNIEHGTTVTWRFQGHNSHTVTSGTPSDSSAGKLFDSGELSSGDFLETFPEVGTISYFCRVHGETGKLQVQ